MKKLKYLFFIMLATFISVTSVNAMETSTQIGETDFYLPPYATFADCNNGRLTRAEGVATNGLYFAPETLVTNGSNTDGMGVAFTSESLFVKDYYYMVTLLVGFGDASIYPKETLSRVCIHHSLQTVIDGFNSNTGCTNASFYTWDNVSPFTTQDGTTVNLGMISYMFTSPVTAKSFVGVMNSSSYRMGYQTLGGVLVQQLADNKTFHSLSAADMHNIINNSGLASASSIAEIQAAQEQIKQGIQEQTQEQIKTNEKLDDLNQNITNDNVNGVENSFESFEDFISENSTITQLITMPITLYTSILNGLQSTCQPFSLGNLFGTNLTLPCINIANYLGVGLWTTIDIIISGFAIFAISKKLIKVFNNFSSMKEGDVIND